MTMVIGVRFRTAGKIYFFAPGKLQIKQGDHVIVETARGVEYGRVVSGPKEVKDEEVVQPLKPVIRIATAQDDKTEEKNREKEKEAFQICLEKDVYKRQVPAPDASGAGWLLSFALDKRDNG